MASSSLPCFLGPTFMPSQNYRTEKISLQVRAQGFRDKDLTGRPTKKGAVDANLEVLRERIQVVGMRERLESSCCRCDERSGWNYNPTYDDKHKREKELSQLLECMGIVGGTVGLTLFGCTLCLFLVSLVAHLNQFS